MAYPDPNIVVSDSTLGIGETSLVTFAFDQRVYGFDNGDLTISNGTLSPLTSSDGRTYTATFTPTDGVASGANYIILDNSGVIDSGGVRAGDGLTYSNSYAVDTARPTAGIVVADPALAIGETTLVTFTFSEAVTGFDNADLTIANGVLTAVSSGDGGSTWTATFTPTATITDATNLITLDNTGVADAAGNAGAGSTDSNNYAIDTTGPTATIVLADTALGVGETSAVTITFSEAVSGFDNSDLTVVNGTLSAVATTNNVTWTATFTPTAAIADATNVIALANTGVRDAALNAGSGTSASANFTIDTTVAPPEPPPPPAVGIGTTESDVIVGDASNNTVAAGEAPDTVTGGAGDDSISGDAGADHLQGNVGADSLSGGADEDVVLGGQDNDFVQGNAAADYVSGDRGDDRVHGGQGADVVYGGAGDDFAFGDRDNDTVRGGQGNDLVFGGDGDDYVSGDRGSDTVSGGLGADLFHTSGDAGLDLVTDFSLNEGDRVMLDAGTTYTLAQVGTDTVISMGGGGQMVLANVQLATLAPGWIFGA